MSKTVKAIEENRRGPVEGLPNEVSKQYSECIPRRAGFLGDIKGHNHLRESKPVGAAPDARLSACRNNGCAVGAAGPSQLTRSVLGGA